MQAGKNTIKSYLAISSMKYNRIAVLILIIMGLWAGSCKKQLPGTSSDTKAVEDIVIVVTPHNENIKYEIEEGFKADYLGKYGKSVSVQWRDVGSGSSSILQYLRNVYANATTSGIDVLLGGGEYTFQTLSAEGLLEPLKLPEEMWEYIPADLGGMELYDKNKMWCGVVLSSFGFIYNKELLKQLNLAEPARWDDLGKSEYYDLLVLADPTQSGSVAAAYEMIVQSETDWAKGWTKLLMLLSNAKKFTDNSGAAANAPVVGEAAISVCIDFFGLARMEQAPDKLGFICPIGQSAFTPDPVAILKNAPHGETARRFTEFLLSEKGQSLWAFPVGIPNGPKRTSLNRPPIRKDFYTTHAAQIPSWLTRPYEEGRVMKLDAKLRSVRYGVLAQLIKAAAIDNISFLRAAQKRVIEKNYDPALVELMTRLPENIDTIEEIYTIGEQFKDNAARERIVTDWTDWYRKNFKQVAE